MWHSQRMCEQDIFEAADFSKRKKKKKGKGGGRQQQWKPLEQKLDSRWCVQERRVPVGKAWVSAAIEQILTLDTAPVTCTHCSLAPRPSLYPSSCSFRSYCSMDLLCSLLLSRPWCQKSALAHLTSRGHLLQLPPIISIARNYLNVFFWGT